VTISSTTMKKWKLPPLILHPFAETKDQARLVEAELAQKGILPSGETTQEAIDQQLLAGRYSEVRMLFYVGRDLTRWIDQCLDLTTRDEELKKAGLTHQSFAAILVESPPTSVEEKLKTWGIADHRSIFSRALGMNAIFAELPAREILSDEFLRNYYRYADQLYASRQLLWAFSDISPSQFDFDLFASGEYSRMLEMQWKEENQV
jgi:hypothetical protein